LQVRFDRPYTCFVEALPEGFLHPLRGAVAAALVAKLREHGGHPRRRHAPRVTADCKFVKGNTSRVAGLIGAAREETSIGLPEKMLAKRVGAAAGGCSAGCISV